MNIVEFLNSLLLNTSQNRQLNSLFFLEYMGPLFTINSNETTDYAARQLNDPNRKNRKDDDKWTNTTPDEIKGYFALAILMLQVRKS